MGQALLLLPRFLSPVQRRRGFISLSPSRRLAVESHSTRIAASRHDAFLAVQLVVPVAFDDDFLADERRRNIAIFTARPFSNLVLVCLAYV